MSILRQQNTTNYPVQFFLTKNTDHVSPATGVTPTLFLSKNGSAFSASPAAGAVTELQRGFYSWAGNATDRNTLGELLVDISGSNFDNIGFKLTIVPYDPFNNVVAVSGNYDKSGYSLSSAVAVSGNYDKTGYSLTQAFPSNFSSLTITGGAVVVNDFTPNGSGMLNSAVLGSPNNWSALSSLNGLAYYVNQIYGDTLGMSTKLSVARAGYLDNLNIGGLVQPSGGTSLSASDVWTYSTRSLNTAVAVSGNYDKTGYSLTQAFPSNFSSLTITGGAVTVGTNNDKTGYSLSSAVAVSGNYDKTGYFISGTKTTLDSLNDITAGTVRSQASGALADFRLNELFYNTFTGLNNNSFAEHLVETSGIGYRFKRLALSLGPTGSGGSSSISAEDVWTYGTRALTTAVSVSGNYDKVGYSLNSAVSVSGNYDKTGYSLTQAFPSNFSSLSITGGAVIVNDFTPNGSGMVNAAVLGAPTALTWAGLASLNGLAYYMNSVYGDTLGLSTKLSSARAGYLDNLNIGGLVAPSSIIPTLANIWGYNSRALTSAVAVSGNYDKTGYFISGTKTTLDSLNDVSVSNIYSQASGALYDFGLNKFNYLVQASGISYRFTQLALSLGPSGSGGSTSLSASDIWSHGTRTLTALDSGNVAESVWTRTVRNITGGSGVSLSTSEDIYFADIQFTRDQSNTKDEYTVGWFKNGTPFTTAVTTPTIQVIKRSDGTDLIASSSMSSIINGVYKYDASGSNRITLGEAVVVQVAGTLDGATRTWRRNITRDSE